LEKFSGSFSIVGRKTPLGRAFKRMNKYGFSEAACFQ
jgi:hypothetical protein